MIKLLKKLISGRPIGRLKWIGIVQEKIHGANFSFTTDGDTVLAGKRNSYITQEERKTFFSCGEIIDRYSKNILLLSKEFPGKIIRVYGEIYGNYLTEEGLKPVQRKILYSNGLDFRAFDVHVEDEFLDTDISENLLSKYMIPYCSPIYIGEFNHCLEYCRGNTKSSYPIMKCRDRYNTKEGDILRPISSRYGVIYKVKNFLFIENRETMLSYVNNNRLDSVISKTGVKTERNEVIQMIVNDAIDDIKKENRFSNREIEDNKDSLLYHVGLVYDKFKTDLDM